MNPKKLRILFIFGIIFLIIVITIAVIIGNPKNNNEKNDIKDESKSYKYSFNETVDLDNVDINDNSEFGTDAPDYGTMNEFYENTDYYFDDRDLYVQTYDGYDVISEQWKYEGYGGLVDKPSFGTLEKFILSKHQASARYNDVKMRDVVSYIKELKEEGFNEVVRDERNNGADYYIYSAKKGEDTVTLNYENGSLLIEIF